MKNKRLEKIMEYIPASQVLADIGTDHGYIPVEAVNAGRVCRAIAADISKGSLKKATAEIEKNNLAAKIQSRWGSGLSILEIDEADVVVIAGMGGNLIADILEQDYSKKFVDKIPLLILQPVQFPEKLRIYLWHKGFRIMEEDLVKDEGIIYQVIVAQKSPAEIKMPSSALSAELGDINIAKKSPLLRELLSYRMNGCKKILADLAAIEGEKILHRRQELMKQLGEYEELMSNAFGGTEEQTE